MPVIGGLHLLIAISLALHAHKTGRPQFWFYILMFVPLVGSIAYVLFEILPEVAGTRRGRKVARDLVTVINPDAEWRRLRQQVDEVDTAEAKYLFAEECVRKGMWAEAIVMYRRAATGMYADDPDMLRGLARAQLGSGDAKAAEETLSRLRAARPDYQNQDAHLTFARALEEQGRLREAETEYRALAGYFVGLEARTRYGLLLQKLGEPIPAKAIFADVVKASKVRGIVLSDDDMAWLKIARKES
jgi:hypothetical protein